MDCETYITCDDSRKGLSAEDLFKLLVLVDDDGCPVLNVNAVLEGDINANLEDVEALITLTNTAIGTPASTEASTDTGTFSLISLFKRLLTKLTAGINVGGFTSKIAFAPTTSSTAYAAGDNIGGVITLTSILRSSGGTGILESISLWALANQKPNLYIDFWDSSPSGTYTNDAAQVIAGDQLKWLGMVEIAAADWKDTGVISRCSVRPTNFGLKGNASANIFMTIQDKTGITLGSSAGLFGYVTCLQD